MRMGRLRNKVLGKGFFPSSLEDVRLGGYFKFQKGTFAKKGKLKSLSLRDYQGIFEAGVLPEGLEELRLSSTYQHRLRKKSLPSSLKKVWIPFRYPYELPEGIELFS